MKNIFPLFIILLLLIVAFLLYDKQQSKIIYDGKLPQKPGDIKSNTGKDTGKITNPVNDTKNNTKNFFFWFLNIPRTIGKETVNLLESAM